MLLSLILKLIVVAFFLVNFLRGSRLVWGIGLITVTTALLLDAFLGTFGWESVQTQLGFFLYVIGGALFAGGALWLLGLLRPALGDGAAPGMFRPTAVGGFVSPAPAAPSVPAAGGSTAFDRQMLYDQIRNRFGPEDVHDLIFDLGLNPNDIFVPNQTYAELAINLMDTAEQLGKMGELALAVERVLTPPAADSLPRLEKLSPDSPPTVLRHFLLAHYDLSDLRAMSIALEIDWEQLGGGGKKEMVRSLLLYLYRRNRVDALLYLLQTEVEPEPTG